MDLRTTKTLGAPLESADAPPSVACIRAPCHALWEPPARAADVLRHIRARLFGPDIRGWNGRWEIAPPQFRARLLAGADSDTRLTPRDRALRPTEPPRYRIQTTRVPMRSMIADPPAIAPTMKNGSLPAATAAGSGASGGSCDRSCSQAKNRT